MHPSVEDIRKYLIHALDGENARAIQEHVASCVFCRELIENMELLDESLLHSQTDLPPKARQQEKNLYYNSLQGHVIDMNPLLDSHSPGSFLLAADTDKESLSGVENISTLYSENPEIVLRVMRNYDRKQDYLQLIAEEKELFSYVMVRIPELGFECLTDDKGMAIIEGINLEKLEQLHWQVQMPDAVFSLEPMTYDPDKVEYAKEIELATDNDDRIQVRFEGKTEGKQVSIKILELDGKKEFGELKVALVQQGEIVGKDVSSNGSIIFKLNDTDAEIQIRLFQQ